MTRLICLRLSRVTVRQKNRHSRLNGVLATIKGRNRLPDAIDTSPINLHRCDPGGAKGRKMGGKRRSIRSQVTSASKEAVAEKTAAKKSGKNHRTEILSLNSSVRASRSGSWIVLFMINSWTAFDGFSLLLLRLSIKVHKPRGRSLKKNPRTPQKKIRKKSKKSKDFLRI